MEIIIVPTPEGLGDNSQQQLTVILIITDYQALTMCQALGTIMLLNLSLVKFLQKDYYFCFSMNIN